jgi:hypothetical protein
MMSEKLAETMVPDDVRPADYDAIRFTDGHGTDVGLTQ